MLALFKIYICISEERMHWIMQAKEFFKIWKVDPLLQDGVIIVKQ